MTWKDETDKILKRRELAKAQGGAEAVARQHGKGRLTIRERILALLDDGSFDEIGMGAGDAELDGDGNLKSFSPANYVLGFGKIDGRSVVVGVARESDESVVGEPRVRVPRVAGLHAARLATQAPVFEVVHCFE